LGLLDLKKTTTTSSYAEFLVQYALVKTQIQKQNKTTSSIIKNADSNKINNNIIDH
jgi:hypothetical protein